MKMIQAERKALVKRRNAFLERIAKKRKPSAKDRREFSKLRKQIQILIQAEY